MTVLREKLILKVPLLLTLLLTNRGLKVHRLMLLLLVNYVNLTLCTLSKVAINRVMRFKNAFFHTAAVLLGLQGAVMGVGQVPLKRGKLLFFELFGGIGVFFGGAAGSRVWTGRLRAVFGSSSM